MGDALAVLEIGGGYPFVGLGKLSATLHFLKFRPAWLHLFSAVLAGVIDVQQAVESPPSSLAPLAPNFDKTQFHQFAKGSAAPVPFQGEHRVQLLQGRKGAALLPVVKSSQSQIENPCVPVHLERELFEKTTRDRAIEMLPA